jgi:hypothetical protein
MNHSFQPVKRISPLPKARKFPRRPVLFAYAELGHDVGGVILNFSEGGFCVQTTAEIVAEPPLPVRFQSFQSGGWVEAKGRIAWRNETKTVTGIEFVDIAEEARQEIRKWLGFTQISGAGGGFNSWISPSRDCCAHAAMRWSSGWSAVGKSSWRLASAWARRVGQR